MKWIKRANGINQIISISGKVFDFSDAEYIQVDDVDADWFKLKGFEVIECDMNPNEKINVEDKEEVEKTTKRGRKKKDEVL